MCAGTPVHYEQAMSRPADEEGGGVEHLRGLEHVAFRQGLAVIPFFSLTSAHLSLTMHLKPTKDAQVKLSRAE